MDAMQSHRDRSHSSAGRHGPLPDAASSSGGSVGSNNHHYQSRHNDDGRRPNCHHHEHSTSRPSPSVSLSSSRWEPPKGRISHQHSPDSVASSGGGNGFARSMPNQERETNNCRGGRTHNNGGGQRGGGKITNRQRHHSNDTRNQRNQHRHQRQQQQQQPKKKIITPDEAEPTSSSSATDKNSNGNNNETTTLETETLQKLDPADAAHAKRMRQRRRQVLFGKNTAGYEEYTKQVPRHKRRQRSLECPMTPDHMVDIPAKRWQGLMNAWRRALHTYDPPDLHLRQPAQKTISLAPRPCVTEEDKQQEEIAHAKAAGLQVAFGSMAVGKEAGMFSFKVAAEDDEQHVVASAADDTVGGGTQADDGGRKKTLEIPMEEEAAYQQMQSSMDGGFLEEGCDSDSDDDLL